MSSSSWGQKDRNSASKCYQACSHWSRYTSACSSLPASRKAQSLRTANEITLRDDDPQAFALLCKIIHMKYPLQQSPLGPDELQFGHRRRQIRMHRSSGTEFELGLPGHGTPKIFQRHVQAHIGVVPARSPGSLSEFHQEPHAQIQHLHARSNNNSTRLARSGVCVA